MQRVYYTQLSRYFIDCGIVVTCVTLAPPGISIPPVSNLRNLQFHKFETKVAERALMEPLFGAPLWLPLIATTLSSHPAQPLGSNTSPCFVTNHFALDSQEHCATSDTEEASLGRYPWWCQDVVPLRLTLTDTACCDLAPYLIDPTSWQFSIAHGPPNAGQWTNCSHCRLIGQCGYWHHVKWVGQLCAWTDPIINGLASSML